MADAPRRYLRWFFASFVLVLVCAAVVSLLVDPYRLVGSPIGLRADAARPRAVQQLPLVKRRGIVRTAPRTLVLGNSRAEIGFDPRGAAWPGDWQVVYNAAIPGSWLKTDFATLRMALDNAPVGHVVIGLEFLDFLTAEDEPLEDDDETAPSTALTSAPALRTLFSLDSVADSVVTVVATRDPFAADTTSRGFNPLHEYVPMVRREGHSSLFVRRDTENARHYAKLPKSLYRRGGETSAPWRYLQRVQDLAAARGIPVQFVIYPYHAHTLELFRAAGLWPLFEEWKRVLVTRLPDEAKAGRCALWDFSGYHRYATEPVPVGGDTRDMQWYWEGGHFKAALGERMLERVVGASADDPSFGTCLSRANVEAAIAGIRASRTAYVAADPSGVASMAELFEASR
jgi:hypothetical protein